jgi:hypothetical protein
MTTAERPTHADQRGFAVMIVVIVILGLLAIGLGAVVPAMFQQIGDARERATRDLLQQIHQGIVGDKQNSFGYYGDVGEFPVSLMDLVRDPGKPGWSGPYVDAGEGGIANGQVVDFYGNPIEYFLDVNVDNEPAYLAVVSRGPDGISTNSDATPNETWAGTPPTDNGYMGQAGNADNLVFPVLNSVNNSTVLEQVLLGTLRTTFTNVDQNFGVELPMCPGLYTLTATPLPRPTDVRTWSPGIVQLLGAAQGVQLFDVEQGTWNLTLTSPLASAPLYQQTVTVLPNSTTLQTAARMSSLDSSGTASATLAIRNTYATTDLDVYVNGVEQSNWVRDGTTRNYTVAGCAIVAVTERNNQNNVLDAFYMPYGVATFTRVEGASTIVVTIRNVDVAPELKVYFNGNNTSVGPQLGHMADTERKGYSIKPGDYLWITDSTGAVIYGPAQQNVSSTKTCTRAGGCV